MFVLEVGIEEIEEEGEAAEGKLLLLLLLLLELVEPNPLSMLDTLPLLSL